MKELSKRFNHKERESEIYKAWEESGFFTPEVCIEKGLCDENAEVFSMVLPPPNVTGTLHIGSSYMLALEDIMTRYARMRGKRTLWLPGTDHAAIATQAKVERQLWEQEKKTRHDLGRKKFLERVEEFAQKSQHTILSQLRRFGCSLDWSRLAYTLDEPRELAVRTAFKKMYDAGLIYRGDRIVNWDPKMQTTVSDDEVEYEERTSPLYYIRYGPFTVATVRPETIFGDTAIAVNPDDARYKEYIGEEVEVDLLAEKRKLKVIADEYVDPEFGTGALKITPAHDPGDFDVWLRHKDEIEGPISAIDEEGKLTDVAGPYAGMNAEEARVQIAEDLKKKELLEDVDEKYTNKVAVNSRGGGRIEPLVKKQWFVDVNREFTLENSKIKGIDPGSKTTLKKLMRTVVESGQIRLIPKRFEKIYFHWIDNLRDWNISRQIWYGHRVPVFYCNKKQGNPKQAPKPKTQNPKPIVAVERPEQCPNCQECEMEQDPDTLDTWFSSGLWTFSTLGWPHSAEASRGKPSDLDIYHPTTMLETGWDILFFWVARMVLMSGFLLGNIPFKNVYLHGLVRDEKNRKMSKSLDNIIDPVDVIEEYGADALRMALIVGSSPGRDLPFSTDKVRGYRNFGTKLWNVTRFLLMNVEDGRLPEGGTPSKDDTAIRANFQKAARKATEDMEKYRYSQAAETLYHYAWHTFADEVLEASKDILQGENREKKDARIKTLIEVWADTLKALHPFMPYVTEELYQYLPLKDRREFLMVEKWPV